MRVPNVVNILNPSISARALISGDRNRQPVNLRQLAISRSLSASQVEYLVLNMRGREWRSLKRAAQDCFIELCFNYWRLRGFPHYTMSDTQIAKEYGRLARTTRHRILLGDEIQIAMTGVKLANLFHPQMWSVQVKDAWSPKERFDDDVSLRKLIRHALLIWPERKATNDINLRAMLRTFSRTTRVSNFRPTAAKVIYELFSNDGDTVIDFSAGYGGRLLGCLPLRRRYLGIDPCQQQIRGLSTMEATLTRIAPLRAKVEIRMGCAEDVLGSLPLGSASLVFSSPPYFDLERYSDDQSQSYVRYPKYTEWLDGFLKRIIGGSHRVLKRKGYLALNVADSNGFPLIRDTKQLATGKFDLVRTLKLRMPQKPYLRARNGSVHKYEDVFVFRKR